MDMSKWFDTNYHFLVPELDDSSAPNPDFVTFLDKVQLRLFCGGNLC